MAFPPQIFYTIDEVATEWNVPSSTITKAILSSNLLCHFWLDKVVVYHFTEEDEGNTSRVSKNLKSINGYMPMYEEDCRILFKQKQIALRRFRGNNCNEYYWLPQRAVDVFVQPDDLVILREEKERFEELHELKPKKSKLVSSLNIDSKNSFEFSADFREVKINGEYFGLGEMQANIVKYLYEASKTDLPWVNGKKLLQNVNSNSFVMRDVFKSHSNWKNLILSDGKGRYRLNI
ncbi:MAG: hypothetical protein SFT90_07335 [Rickettsiales bacterium]|nr:hypothetical protein [Rickettsiales bacterium]